MLALGVQTWGTDLPALRRYWTAADQLGFARITYGDGLWSWTHDGWTMLAALAVAARRARIGPAVTYAFHPAAHHPAWLAKRAVAVDHLSGGRLDLRLGVGAEDADTANVWAAHGIPYPPAAERVARLDETLRVLRALFSGEAVTHQGPLYRLAGARLEPAALQPHGPPVWVAAMRPRALDVVARWADGWEASYLSAPAFAERWAALATRLRAAGRPPESLRRSVELDVVLAEHGEHPGAALERFRRQRDVAADHPLLTATLSGNATDLRQTLAAYAGAGATDLMLAFADFPETRMLERFAADVLAQ